MVRRCLRKVSTSASFGRLIRFLAPLLVLSAAAHAERLTFRSFGPSEGLTSLAGQCMTHDRTGHVLVCSEHGLFVYNGRRFVNIGTTQGLRDGGVIYDLVQFDDGRIAVRYADAVFVSRLPIGVGASPNDLAFERVGTDATTSFYRERGAQIAPWRGGLAIVVGGRTMQVASDPSGARIVPIDYTQGEQAALADPTMIFSVRDRLWETFDDGRVCSADPGFVTCYGQAQGLTGGPGADIIAGADGTILVRSDNSVATIDVRTGRATEEALPHQGGRYQNYIEALGLFRTPSGDLITQSNDGLIIRRPSGWTQFTTRDGLPLGIIVAAMHDDDGQMWFQMLGRGLFMALGYGQWEGLQKSDGLSDTVAWQSVRVPGGGLWVSTDGGLDEVRTTGAAPEVTRVVPGASFAMAVGPDGRIWSAAGERDARIIDPTDGSVVRLPLPPVDAIAAGPDPRVWFATEKGLYRADVAPGASPSAVRDGVSKRPVNAVLSDGSGGAWLLSDGRFWHRHPGGDRTLVAGPWPTGGFEPLVVARAPDGSFWIGGGGGLFRFEVSRDRVTSMTAIPQSDIQSNSVVAVTVDHRGWIWVGTGEGVSVFDGPRWISANVDDGLVWNDVSQGGIREDPDGSIWIATSEGLSHLRHPAQLFALSPLSIVIAEAFLGDTRLPASRIPYSTAALSLDFGTFNYASGRSVVFRYRMSGVDGGWAETASGAVRYPFVPPGRHVLTVVGRDVLDHRVSAPVTLTVDMAYPWWRRWWADAIGLLLVLATVYACIKLKTHESLTRQRELERLVDERTRDMAYAQAELRRQATRDGLTGLLNRAEVQRRLADSLSAVGPAGDMIVALVDLDHFKRVNDDHGHLAGDDVLRMTGIRVSAILREREYAGRYGGEEILLVLNDRDGQGAGRVLDLHRSIRQAPFFVDDAQVFVTCSIGVTWAGHGDDWRSLIRRADAALYEAKTTGRDRVVERREDETAGPLVWPGRRRTWRDAAGY